jgi:hypothetical protein
MIVFEQTCHVSSCPGVSRREGQTKTPPALTCKSERCGEALRLCEARNICADSDDAGITSGRCERRLGLKCPGNQARQHGIATRTPSHILTHIQCVCLRADTMAIRDSAIRNADGECRPSHEIRRRLGRTRRRIRRFFRAELRLANGQWLIGALIAPSISHACYCTGATARPGSARCGPAIRLARLPENLFWLAITINSA